MELHSFIFLQMCACCSQLSCESVLTRVLAVGVTQEVTTAAQEADAAVTEVPGATQGAGAASFPQENSGEDTQMLTAPGATEVLVAAGASSTVNPGGAEGRILLQGLISTQDGHLVHLKPVSLPRHSSLNTTSLFK